MAATECLRPRFEEGLRLLGSDIDNLRLLKCYNKNKSSDSSMEVELPALLGNYDRKNDQPTERPGYWEVDTLPVII